MKKKVHKDTYIVTLYIILLLIGRDFAIFGRFSATTILLPIMICHLVLNNSGQRYKDIKSVITLYLIYIIWFFFAGSLNGDFAASSSSLSLFINYFSCIMIATLIALKFRGIQQIKIITCFFYLILIFNILITILQFFNLGVGWTIWEWFNPDIDALTEEHFMDAIQGGGQELGISFSPGFFQSGVTNGYFMASFGLLPLVLSAMTSSTCKRVLLYCTYIFSLITLFIIQQRAAFFIFLFFSLLILYKTIKVQKGFLFITFLGVLYLVASYDGVLELGRFREISLEEDSRYILFQQSIDYISHNLILGGRLDFLTVSGKNAHNFIFNAFIYSGLVGAILLISIVCKMMLTSLKALLYIVPSYSLFFSCALITYLLIGFVHNESLVTGTPVIFILYSLLVVTFTLEKQR